MFNGHITKQWRLRQDQYIRQRNLHTITRTGANWSLRTLTILWTDFFCLWKARNESIHGHDLSSQHQARHRRLCAEMEDLHSQRDQVLASDADVFIGETAAALDTFLTVSTASHIQNWLHVWRPTIISSIKAARDQSVQGVQTLSTYFAATTRPPQATNTGPRHPNPRAHRTARPRRRDQLPILPQPSFRFCSLRSFFGSTRLASHPPLETDPVTLISP
jgi:hypothetical protein